MILIGCYGYPWRVADFICSDCNSNKWADFSKRSMIVTVAAQEHECVTVAAQEHEWIRCQTPRFSVSCYIDSKFNQTKQPEYFRLIASFSEMLASFRALLFVVLTTLIPNKLNDNIVNFLTVVDYSSKVRR